MILYHMEEECCTYHFSV